MISIAKLIIILRDGDGHLPFAARSALLEKSNRPGISSPSSNARLG
jgi:hypothetical protein